MIHVCTYVKVDPLTLAFYPLALHKYTCMYIITGIGTVHVPENHLSLIPPPPPSHGPLGQASLFAISNDKQ